MKCPEYDDKECGLPSCVAVHVCRFQQTEAQKTAAFHVLANKLRAIKERKKEDK